jgi:hypothetical protein
VGFVVDKMALGQVFSEYFGFPANLHSTNCSTITLIYHLGLYNRSEVAAVPDDVSPTPLKKTGILTLISPTQNLNIGQGCFLFHILLFDAV